MNMNILKELIYPPRCPICDGILLPGAGSVCTDCGKKPEYVTEPACMKCGKPLRTMEEEYCPDCIARKHSFEQGAAVFLYPSVKESIYRFKYKDRQEYADYFGEQIVSRLGKKIRRWKPDGIVPVPLHKKKQRKRGYNQAELLALAVSRKMSIPVYTQLAVRVKNTVPQKKLDVEERENNLKRAFKICQNDVKLETIILIDDIYTTGSTMDALAMECRRAGIEKVYCISLAIGRP